MNISTAPDAPGHYFDYRTPLLDAGSLGALPIFEVMLRGKSLRFSSGSGVFSRGELDEGTRLLLETMDIPLSGRLGDLGCGWGPVAAFLGAHTPSSEIYACDLNPRAVQLTRWNCAANGLSNVYAWCGDGLTAVQPASLDCIVTNPPVRAGNDVLTNLFKSAALALRPGGTLWVVLRTAQGAKSWRSKLEVQFGSCETRAISGGFRILECTLTRDQVVESQ